jgi:hypothetical protein
MYRTGSRTSRCHGTRSVGTRGDRHVGATAKSRSFGCRDASISASSRRFPFLGGRSLWGCGGKQVVVVHVWAAVVAMCHAVKGFVIGK